LGKEPHVSETVIRRDSELTKAMDKIVAAGLSDRRP